MITAFNGANTSLYTPTQAPSQVSKHNYGLKKKLVFNKEAITKYSNIHTSNTKRPIKPPKVIFVMSL
jgi:hypothetical protein